MAITKKRLLGHRAVVSVREDIAAIDAPAAGTWTPDNLNAAEISAGVVADDVILNALEWANVWLTVDFVDGTGAPHAGGTATITMLLSTRDQSATLGRRWKVANSVAGIDGDSAIPMPVSGHDVAFRVDALALGGATAMHVRVTGGEHLVVR